VLTAHLPADLSAALRALYADEPRWWWLFLHASDELPDPALADFVRWLHHVRQRPARDTAEVAKYRFDQPSRTRFRWWGMMTDTYSPHEYWSGKVDDDDNDNIVYANYLPDAFSGICCSNFEFGPSHDDPVVLIDRAAALWLGFDATTRARLWDMAHDAFSEPAGS
jgi:hypothetical protein